MTLYRVEVGATAEKSRCMQYGPMNDGVVRGGR